MLICESRTDVGKRERRDMFTRIRFYTNLTYLQVVLDPFPYQLMWRHFHSTSAEIIIINYRSGHLDYDSLADDILYLNGSLLVK